jgi:hypothetical protein
MCLIRYVAMAARLRFIPCTVDERPRPRTAIPSSKDLNVQIRLVSKNGGQHVIYSISANAITPPKATSAEYFDERL